MLVAIEGIDGSGKGTLTASLLQKALDAGLGASRISFPQYGENAFAESVAEYLNGAYGDLDQVHPKLASLIFAGDRFASKAKIVELMKEGLLISDRYVTSNLAHQAAKLPQNERPQFIQWLCDVEFGIYGLPKPDLVIFLDMPVAAAMVNVHKKAQRGYTNRKADVHEEDGEYLAACREVYTQLAEQHVAGPWRILNCAEGGSLRSMESILDEAWSILREC